MNLNYYSVSSLQEMLSMKPLERSLKKNGYTYNQVSRTNNVAIYEQIDEYGNLVSHEVFEIKILKATKLFGKNVPKREKFPADEDFGLTAFSTGTSLERAKDKAKWLTTDIERRKEELLKLKKDAES